MKFLIQNHIDFILLPLWLEIDAIEFAECQWISIEKLDSNHI